MELAWMENGSPKRHDGITRDERQQTKTMALVMLADRTAAERPYGV